VTGEQAKSYLQGQLSTNTELLDENNAMLTCHCDFKGKMWNANYLINDGIGIDYLVQKSAQEACVAELKKYAVFSKADISQQEDVVFIGVGGKQAIEWLKVYFPNLTDTHLSSSISQQGWVLTLNFSGISRFLCKLNLQSPLLNDLKSEIEETASVLWSAIDAVTGVAPIHGATSNEFVPQMLNMQLLEAIDFNKGCYMGQEVVARTKYLGKNKRATYLLTASNQYDAVVEVGDLLEKAIGENWRRGGTIIHCGQVKEELYVLAVLANDTNTGDVLRLKSHPELLLKVQQLPYELDVD
jgi:folate-binding protein YgfZ